MHVHGQLAPLCPCSRLMDALACMRKGFAGHICNNGVTSVTLLAGQWAVCQFLSQSKCCMSCGATTTSHVAALCHNVMTTLVLAHQPHWHNAPNQMLNPPHSLTRAAGRHSHTHTQHQDSRESRESYISSAEPRTQPTHHPEAIIQTMFKSAGPGVTRLLCWLCLCCCCLLCCLLLRLVAVSCNH